MIIRSIEIGFIMIAGAAATWGLTRVVGTWQRLKGARIVTCTATGYPAAVRIDRFRAAIGALSSRNPTVGVAQCSLWANGRPCDQGCITEALASESAPQSIVARWYAGKRCVYCARPIGHLKPFGHHAALRSREGTTREWSDVAPDGLLDALKTDSPVCWNCHVAETLRRVHPDLVTDRPWPKHADRRVG